MADTQFTEVKYTVSGLIEKIDLGEIGLPDIQRPFVWTTAKVRDLFDSMYRGFPVGYLLFWANDQASGSKQIGSDFGARVPGLLIVDGQQRLTSLYAVMKGREVVRDDYSSQRISISFRPRDGVFSVRDAAIDRDPDYIQDISELWAGSASTFGFIKAFIERLRQRREVTDVEEAQVAAAIEGLYALLRYPFTALVLSSTVDEERVAEVFVRINSQGVTLNQADFILTLMSVFWDEGRANLEQFCRSAWQPSLNGASPFNYFLQPEPDQLLRVAVALGFRRARLENVYSVLRGKDLDTGEFSAERREQQFRLLTEAQGYVLDLTNWHEFLKAIAQAGFRSGAVVSSQMALVYAYSMYLIGKRDFRVDAYRLRQVIARWFFMSSLTARYSSAAESVMEADLARLRQVTTADGFVETLDRVIDDSLTEDFWNITLPNSLATTAARSPALFAYYAALNLLDARVLFSKLKVLEMLDPALKAKRAAVERHHLFPKKYLKGLGVTDTNETNQIANFALVEWSDNVDISGEAPAQYLMRYATRFSGDELVEMSFWHALPEGWELMEYQDFLAARRRLMAGVVRRGFDVLRGSYASVGA